ncbi:hypothetical protein E0H66_21850 [Rhizobium leguminosarum bv. viciae]|nr:hypothetical protein E0H66_21850 [Rhizobium leguminosarum bv. viciae]
MSKGKQPAQIWTAVTELEAAAWSDIVIFDGSFSGINKAMRMARANQKITRHEIAPDRWHLRFGVLFTDAGHGVVCCVSPSPTHAN